MTTPEKQSRFDTGPVSVSVMTQSLVNWPDRIGDSQLKIEILRRYKA